jgi:hypothetical protein
MAAARKRVGPVETAVKADIARIATADPNLAASGLAEGALSVARSLDDPGISATSRSMCFKALMEGLDRLRELAPPMTEETELERRRRERGERRAARGPAA